MSEQQFMTKRQILDTIKDLGRSQGLYERLYRRLKVLMVDNPELYNSTMDELFNQNFKDPVDLVLYFES